MYWIKASTGITTRTAPPTLDTKAPFPRAGRPGGRLLGEIVFCEGGTLAEVGVSGAGEDNRAEVFAEFVGAPPLL